MCIRDRVSLMNIRESMEQREQKMLSPYAALSLCSRGRERQEEECCLLYTSSLWRVSDACNRFLYGEAEELPNCGHDTGDGADHAYVCLLYTSRCV